MPDPATHAHRIEVLVVRDPDHSTDVEVYINGKLVAPDAEQHVDPGAGPSGEDWDQGTARVENDPGLTLAFRAAVVDARNQHADSRFIWR